MGRRIAVIEDDPAVGVMLGKIFRKHGFDATVIDDGRRALAALRAGQYDAAVLDVMLPGADGITILREIRNDPRKGRLPIVLLTASRDEARRGRDGRQVPTTS